MDGLAYCCMIIVAVWCVVGIIDMFAFGEWSYIKVIMLKIHV